MITSFDKEKWINWKNTKLQSTGCYYRSFLKEGQKISYHVVESTGWFSKDVKGESEYRLFLCLKYSYKQISIGFLVSILINICTYTRHLVYACTWAKKGFNILSLVLPRFFYISFCQVSFFLREINSNWFGTNWQSFLKHFQSVPNFKAFSCIYRRLKQYPSNISQITFLNASLFTLDLWSFDAHTVKSTCLIHFQSLYSSS